MNRNAGLLACLAWCRPWVALALLSHCAAPIVESAEETKSISAPTDVVVVPALVEAGESPEDALRRVLGDVEVDFVSRAEELAAPVHVASADDDIGAASQALGPAVVALPMVAIHVPAAVAWAGKTIAVFCVGVYFGEEIDGWLVESSGTYRFAKTAALFAPSLLKDFWGHDASSTSLNDSGATLLDALDRNVTADRVLPMAESELVLADAESTIGDYADVEDAGDECAGFLPAAELQSESTRGVRAVVARPCLDEPSLACVSFDVCVSNAGRLFVSETMPSVVVSTSDREVRVLLRNRSALMYVRATELSHDTVRRMLGLPAGPGGAGAVLVPPRQSGSFHLEAPSSPGTRLVIAPAPSARMSNRGYQRHPQEIWLKVVGLGASEDLHHALSIEGNSDQVRSLSEQALRDLAQYAR